MIWPKIGSNMFNGDTFLICDLCACWVYKDSSAWWCYDCYSMIGWSHQSGKALWQLVDYFERLPETSKWKKSNRIKSNEHHIIKQKRRSCRDSWSKHRQQFLGHARETHWEKSCETSAVCETSKVRILLKALELASKTWNQTQKFATISQLEFLQVLKRFVPCFAQKKPSQIWILLGSYLPLRRHWNHLFLSKMEVRTKVVWERCLHTTPQECVVVNICFSASGSEFLDLKQVAWWQREGQLGQFVLSFPALSLRWYQYVFSLGRWVLDNSVIHKIWTHTTSNWSKAKSLHGEDFSSKLHSYSKNLTSQVTRLHETFIWWHVEGKSPLSHQLIVLESQPGSSFTCQTCSINETCALLCSGLSRFQQVLNARLSIFSITFNPTWRKLTGIHNSSLNWWENTHLYTSPHTQNAEPKQRPVMQKLHSWSCHEVMIFTLLPWLSRNTWWFMCNGDRYRKKTNIQPLSCRLF